MGVDTTLPFPRGSTYADLGALTLAADSGDGIVGQLCHTVDSSNRPLVLRVVQADNALTDVGGRPVSYTSGLIGRNVDALCNADGEVSSIIDDAYATTYDISQYDLFYVVHSGYVNAAAGSDVNAAGIAVSADASSDDVQTAAAGEFVIGVSAGAVAAGVASIQVFPDLKLTDLSA
tara:strand:- start:1297 stop:1824 length:528 start_codon:yes stop_codon:yes gene_type:complete